MRCHDSVWEVGMGLKSLKEAQQITKWLEDDKYHEHVGRWASLCRYVRPYYTDWIIHTDNIEIVIMIMPTQSKQNGKPWVAELHCDFSKRIQTIRIGVRIPSLDFFQFTRNSRYFHTSQNCLLSLRILSYDSRSNLIFSYSRHIKILCLLLQKKQPTGGLRRDSTLPSQLQNFSNSKQYCLPISLTARLCARACVGGCVWSLS